MDLFWTQICGSFATDVACHSALSSAATSANAVASIVYAGFTLLMLFELRKSRRQSVTPLLILLGPGEAKVFYVWLSDAGDDTSQFGVAKLDSGERGSVNPPFPNHSQSDLLAQNLVLKNVGSAPAINIRVDWEVIAEEISAALNRSDFFRKLEARADGDFLNLGHIGMYRATNTDHTSLPFCVATPSSPDCTELTVPYGILVRWIFSLFLCSRDEMSTRARVRVTLGYSDVNGNRYESKWLLSVRPVAMWGDSVFSGPNYLGHRAVMDADMLVERENPRSRFKRLWRPTHE